MSQVFQQFILNVVWLKYVGAALKQRVADDADISRRILKILFNILKNESSVRRCAETKQYYFFYVNEGNSITLS